MKLSRSFTFRLLAFALIFTALPVAFVVAGDDDVKLRFKKLKKLEQLRHAEIQAAEEARRKAQLLRDQQGWSQHFVHELVADGKQYEIEVQSGAEHPLHVQMNGEEVPEDRIRRDGDQVEILDEDGNVVLKMNIGTHGRVDLPHLKDVPHFSHGWVTLGGEPAGKRPIIGISMGPVEEALASHLELEEDAIIIKEVHEGYPAETAGLEKHDIITHVDGEPGVTMGSIRDAVLDRTHGEVIRLGIIRRGRPMDVVVAVEERELPGMELEVEEHVWEDKSWPEPRQLEELHERLIDEEYHRSIRTPKMPEDSPLEEVDEDLQKTLDALKAQLEELQKKVEQFRDR